MALKIMWGNPISLYTWVGGDMTFFIWRVVIDLYNWYDVLSLHVYKLHVCLC
jgi:hypothetical protein